MSSTIYDQREDYANNRAFFNGAAGAQLTVTSTQQADEVRAVFNYAKIVIRKHANRLPLGLTVTAGDAAAQAHLTDFNEARRLWTRAALNAAIDGDVCLCVLADRLELIDADNWDVRSWRGDGQPAELIILDNDTAREWRDETMPFVTWPNLPRESGWWGESDLRNIKAAARLLNENLNQLFWGMRVNGNPIIRVIGAEASSLRVGPGEIWQATSPDATIDLVALLDGDAVKARLDTIALARKTLLELSNTPASSFGEGYANQSADALRQLYAPMIEVVQLKREIWRDAITRAARIRLRLRGHANAATVPLTVTFADVTQLFVSDAKTAAGEAVTDDELLQEKSVT